MKSFSRVLLLLLWVASSASATRRATNAPYIQAIEGRGTIYARCIPEEAEGTKGTTTIYIIGKEKDKKLDSYSWYSPGGVLLAWSPIDGKVAVMSLRASYKSEDNGIEFSFYLGGQHLRSYTARELQKLGVESLPLHRGHRLNYTALGVEQIPLGTNEYAFVVEINRDSNGKTGGRKLFFDIVTGQQKQAK